MTVVLPTFVSLVQGVPTVPAGTVMPVNMPSGNIAGDVLLVFNVTIQPDVYGAPTAAPGWELAGQVFSVQGTDMRAFYKVADGTEGTSEDFVLPNSASPRTNQYFYSAVAYRNAADIYTAVTNASSGLVSSWTSPTYSAIVQSLVVAMFDGGTSFSGPGATADGGSTVRSASLTQPTRPWILDKVSGPGTTSGSTVTRVSPDPLDNSNMAAISVGLRPANSAPYAPTLVNLAAGETIDVAIVNRAYHVFSDPDDDLDRVEGQSGFDIRYRVVGAPSWTTVTQAGNTNQFYDFPASTFTTGLNYERQVRVYDLAVEVGPWSTSGFFTGGTAPDAPVITSPLLNEEMDAVEDLVWTATGQDSAYQVRKVADLAGAPDTSIIYYDSGEVADPATREVTLTFPVNNRFEHLQVRVFDGILWSQWASRRVEVAYTPPPAPVVTLSVDAELGAIVIEYDTPAPVGDQPTPTTVDIWINDGGDIGDERKATGLPIDGEWVYMTPRSGRDYEPHIRVISYTADGIPSE